MRQAPGRRSSCTARSSHEMLGPGRRADPRPADCINSATLKLDPAETREEMEQV